MISIMKYLCGIFVLVSVISAHPSSENFGDGVRRSLIESGVDLHEIAKLSTSKGSRVSRGVTDSFWSNCGKFSIILNAA